MLKKHNFYSYTRAELAELLAEQFAAPSYRADQLFDWVYRKKRTDWEEMSNLSQDLRKQLSNFFDFPKAKALNIEQSKDGTRKYAFRVPSEYQVETVLIHQDSRKTLCVSSQYGCGMGCTFCQTATMGFQGNLASSDIISQVLAVQEDRNEDDSVFQNVVFMGMGEPLHNLKGVVKAVSILIDPFALEIPPRKITVSTVGLVPAIKKFGEANLGVNLAVSLNATTNEVRSKIMPINKKFPIEVLIKTLEDYPLAKRKKITIEYVMLAGVNDSPEDLSRLPKLLKNVSCKVNLIPYNDNAGLGFLPPNERHVNKWQSKLQNLGLDTTIRWSKGKDINAACGQLIRQADTDYANLN